MSHCDIAELVTLAQYSHYCRRLSRGAEEVAQDLHTGVAYQEANEQPPPDILDRNDWLNAILSSKCNNGEYAQQDRRDEGSDDRKVPSG